MKEFTLPAVNEYMKDLQKLFKSKEFISFSAAMEDLSSLNNGDKEVFIVYVTGGPLDKETPIKGFLTDSLDVINYECIYKYPHNYPRIDGSKLILNIYKLKETK